MNNYKRYDAPFLEISRDNLIHNFGIIAERSGGRENVLAVVKDDSYGCGAEEIAKVLEAEGLSGFVVARFSEARKLRELGIKSELIVLGKFEKNEVPEAVRLNIGLTINDVSELDVINNFSQVPLVHLNIDTGMSRMGISENELSDFLNVAKRLGLLRFRSVFSHLATADTKESVKCLAQVVLFEKILSLLKKNGIEYDFSHLSNSAGLINFTADILKHKVRAGISLYGLKVDSNSGESSDYRQIMTVKARVAKVKKLDPGTSVSYGANFTADKQTNIAVLPIGYAHGYPRSMSCGYGRILINGKLYPVVGNVTMDYTIVNVGVDDVSVGDVAIITDSENITADDIAVSCGTIGYEIICNFGLRNNNRFFC